ncbi:NRAMP (natural resistance-associated macrophage protein) metal ion transporters [Haladaptatus litoreus]|uniref:NRAMP (Natural resistance-associated macrophage protein) metal ion transporters n=1 Tax=Haladaptatus litoreus TaxID=553468 RepID=A0A1N7EB40_9EURY|nr:Nramp family divalent metal transporter [Haladaptatus litoreus]SIR85155.1 NRAMP (natural resistance-associated macrophage protein) metal ion transporters [Haladaptatus litoreus]
MNIIDKIQSIGPGAMVAAAFIGPGTVTTASVTGAEFGYALVWTIVFSIVATIVLQEMSARLGVVSRNGLGEALKEQFDNPVLSTVSIALVVSAIGIGTAAYETGNILGGAAGLAGITGISANIWGPLMGLCAGALLWTGRYKLIEKALVGLVALMAVAFVINAILIGPDLNALAMGFVPSVPEGSIFLITGLIGTTVVGYNLFLHAGSVQERWAGPDELGESRADTILSILVGGGITIAILVTAAAVFPVGTEISDVSTMAEQIEPLAGTQATVLFSIGLFAAGFTSATTAPLAGAYATAGALGWDTDLKATKFRAVWGSILLIGIVFSGLGLQPVEAIVFAQVANGILLPIVAVFLIYVMNDRDILGEYVNSTAQNVIGVVVTLVVVWLGLRSLYGVGQSLGVF